VAFVGVAYSTEEDEKRSGSTVITCNNNEYHRLSFMESETIGSVRDRAAKCCGIPKDRAALIDYWPYPCQMDTGFNELYDTSKTMGQCGYKYSTPGLTSLLAQKEYLQNDKMATYLSVYYADSKLLKMPVPKETTTILRFKAHISKYVDIPKECMTIVDWYINPQVEKTGGQLQDEMTFGFYNIKGTMEDKKRLVIILNNKDCTPENPKPLKPGTWVMYNNNIIANIECKDDEKVGEFKKRASTETGIPGGEVVIFDLLPNQEQDKDGGLKDEKKMSDYGGCEGKTFVVGRQKPCRM